MCHGSHAPDDDRKSKANARAKAVVNAPGDALADGVGQQKGCSNPSILRAGDAKLGAEAGKQQANAAAVDVVDAGDDEDQREDVPAQSANERAARGCEGTALA